MHPFYNPLKSSKNFAVFWCFQGVEKGCIGKKWVNRTEFTTNSESNQKISRILIIYFEFWQLCSQENSIIEVWQGSKYTSKLFINLYNSFFIKEITVDTIQKVFNFCCGNIENNILCHQKSNVVHCTQYRNFTWFLN